MDTFPLPQDSSEAMTFEQYKSQQAPIQVNLLDTLTNPFKEAADGTAVNLLARRSAVNELQATGAKDLTPEQANARYPEMSTKWNKPVNPYVAQMLSDREQEQRQRQLAIDMGPQDPFSKTIQFGAGLLAHAMDPLETGAGMLTGWGVGAVVAKSVWGSAAVKAIAEGSASFGTRAAFHGIEAVSGNLIQNTALEAGGATVNNMEGGQFSPEEAMQNVAVNTFFGSLFHGAIKEASYGLSVMTPARRLTRFLKNTDPKYDVVLARSVVGALTDNIHPAPEKIMQAIVGETDVRGEYQYQPLQSAPEKVQTNEVVQQGLINKIKEMTSSTGTLDLSVAAKRQILSEEIRSLAKGNRGQSPSISAETKDMLINLLDKKSNEIFAKDRANFFDGINNIRDFIKVIAPEEVSNLDSLNPEARRQKFYIAADNSGQPLPLGDDIGEGVRMTDNPHKAAAAGDVMHEVEASKLNPINTNAPIPENARAAFESAIEGVPTDKGFLDGSARDVLLSIKSAIDEGAIPQERITKLQEDLKGLGYNAFLSDGKDVFGFPHSPHNDLTVFDDSVIEHKNSMDTSQAPKNDPSPQDIQAATDYAKDPKNSLEVDAKQLEQFTKRMQENDSLGLGKDNDFKYLDDQIQVQKDHLESLNKQGILDQQGAAELADIQKYEKLEQVGRTLLKAAADCVTKYG